MFTVTFVHHPSAIYYPCHVQAEDEQQAIDKASKLMGNNWLYCMCVDEDAPITMAERMEWEGPDSSDIAQMAMESAW